MARLFARLRSLVLASYMPYGDPRSALELYSHVMVQVSAPRRHPSAAVLRVRVQIIRHVKSCTADIYIQNDCAHVGVSVHAPVRSKMMVGAPVELLSEHPVRITVVTPAAAARRS